MRPSRFASVVAWRSTERLGACQLRMRAQPVAVCDFPAYGYYGRGDVNGVSTFGIVVEKEKCSHNYNGQHRIIQTEEMMIC